jgi:hypothetical protein
MVRRVFVPLGSVPKGCRRLHADVCLEHARAIKRLAKEDGTSVAEIIREAIAEYTCLPYVRAELRPKVSIGGRRKRKPGPKTR